jgi:hypothetical protein
MEDDEDQKRKGGIVTQVDFIVAEQRGTRGPGGCHLLTVRIMEHVTGTFSTLLRDRYISSSAKGSSTGKSPTLTLSGRTKTPNLGAHVKYRFP